jgi:formylglycine-generating enzyme required for sulfatase activity
MADIFISYAREDRSKVELLVKALEDTGWSVWWDRDIPIAKPWHLVIQEAIDNAKCIMVVWSNASVDSEWVLAEAEEGLRRRVLVPVMFEEVKMPLLFRSLQVADLILWNGNRSEAGYKQLMKALDSILGNVSEQVDQRTGRTTQDVLYAPRGGYELVWITGGEFLMGSPDSKEGWRNKEGPQHAVQVPGFYIGRYPVTNEEYGRFLAEDLKAVEPKYWDRREYNKPRQPVVGVSWRNAWQYAQWAGLQLPSEAQWEYACRAGTSTLYYSGDSQQDLDRVGWHNENSEERLHLVGQKEPNKFGLYDMHGNVWEWVEDAWHENYKGAPNDGSAWIDDRPKGSMGRVARGGSFNDFAVWCQSTFRHAYDWRVRFSWLGFRLVLLPDT